MVEPLVSGRARPSSYRALLRNRNYRLWFTSSLVSSMGDWAGLVALQTLVVTLSPSGSRSALFALGGIMMARLLPSIIVGPVAGVLADRYNRKRLMVVADLARGTLFAVIAFSADITTLFVLTFAVECLSLLYISAKDASLPVIVPRQHLAQANQLNLLVTWGPLPFGAVLATSMIGVAALLRNAGISDVDPTVLALLVNAATFLLAALATSRLVLPVRGRRGGSADDSTGLVEELRAGLAFIAGLPLIRALILGVVGVAFGAGVIVTLGPEFVRTSLGRPSTDWFTLITFVGVGLCAGILVAPEVARRARKERLFPVVLAATGAIVAVMATVPTFAAALPLGFLLGLVAGLGFVTGYTLMHENTDDDVRGKTFAAFYTGTRIAMFTALGVAPFLAGFIGNATLIVAGRTFSMSGVRITILAAGLLALAAAASAGKVMWASVRRPATGAVRLPAPARKPQGGVFIAFEGVEGAGKSTQVQALADTLRDEGLPVVVTREPGGPPLAERLRGLLLDPAAGDISARTEALLYAAARAEHVEQVIRPALTDGKVVLCDRYLDSSLAYQAFARGLGEGDVREINRWATGGLLPDAVVLLEVAPGDGLDRVANRSPTDGPGAVPADRPGAVPADRLEAEGLDFHERVAHGYAELARRDPRRFLVIDGSDDAAQVAARVRDGLSMLLPRPAPPEGVSVGDSEAAR